MLKPQEALKKVLNTARNGRPARVPLTEACFLVAAEQVKAAESYPFFSNSSMDGFAVRSADLKGAAAERPVSLPLAGEVRTAAGETLVLPHGRTIRIMTGGVLPEGADAVVKREDVKERESEIVFYRPAGAGSFINRRGEEIAAGTLLWPAGRQLDPPALGLFASLGIDKVKIYPAPKISLIATGDELVEAGRPRAAGQVCDSISPMLVSCLRQIGIQIPRVLRCRDELDVLTRSIRARLEESDIVITVGGVSMGDYDLVMGSVKRLAVRQVFWKVAQKPGKPLFFGRRRRKLVFGLPGNPASALVCYLLYVLPAIRKIMGFAEPGPFWHQGRLAAAVSNRSSRTCYARGNYQAQAGGGYSLETAQRQSSYMLSSFAGANALIELPPGPLSLAAGRTVNFCKVPWAEPVCR